MYQTIENFEQVSNKVGTICVEIEYLKRFCLKVVCHYHHPKVFSSIHKALQISNIKVIRKNSIISVCYNVFTLIFQLSFYI